MNTEILIITGLSGSGKTVALRALEDIGYFCVDNLPPQLIGAFAENVTSGGKTRTIAIGIDAREREFLSAIETALPKLRETYDVSILFLEAEKDILLRRFKETRRPHPLLTHGIKDLQEAIATEKGLLLPIRQAAGQIVDTSRFTPHQLREHIISLYGPQGARDAMNITVMSFGFKFGVPQNADLIFDVRFLPNPHFVPELKELNGKDAPVRDFVLEKEQTTEFIDRLKGFLRFLLPLYKQEGKSYLTIGIGCTGGRHRSIVIAENIASELKKENINVTIVHRDI